MRWSSVIKGVTFLVCILVVLSTGCGKSVEETEGTESIVISADRNSLSTEEMKDSHENSEMTVEEITEALSQESMVVEESEDNSNNQSSRNASTDVQNYQTQDVNSSTSNDSYVSPNQNTSNGDNNSNQEYVVTNQDDTQPIQMSAQWIYNNSKSTEPLSQENKNDLDQYMAEWIAGNYTDNEVARCISDYVVEHGLKESMPYYFGPGCSGNAKFLAKTEANIPNGDQLLNEMNCYYCFYAIYTNGEHDELGNLICYDWVASF